VTKDKEGRKGRKGRKKAGGQGMRTSLAKLL